MEISKRKKVAISKAIEGEFDGIEWEFDAP